LHTATADPRAVFQHVPLDENIAMTMTEVSRQEIPDLPDRVIAATALFHGVPVLSRDHRIQGSAIQSIW
jgi:predicted nucleic acid-binding protein